MTEQGAEATDPTIAEPDVEARNTAEASLRRWEEAVAKTRDEIALRTLRIDKLFPDVRDGRADRAALDELDAEREALRRRLVGEERLLEAARRVVDDFAARDAERHQQEQRLALERQGDEVLEGMLQAARDLGAAALAAADAEKRYRASREALTDLRERGVNRSASDATDARYSAMLRLSHVAAGNLHLV